MIFIDACFGKKTPYTPIWLMRQAGRYLSEYMEIRNKAGGFLDLCKNPKLAAEVTIQPVDILGVDAAILFSDILLIPMEMGLPLSFQKGEGPVFSKRIQNINDVRSLKLDSASRLTYVYETLRITREKLPKDKALIGFCGSPWTLSTYMIEGEGSKTYQNSKKMLYKNPEVLHELLSKITESLKQYLEYQIQAGANAIMVFDSWAGALESESYFEFSWKYMKDIASHVKAKYPHIPIMLFPKGIPAYLDNIDGDFDVFGVDWSTPLSLAKEKLGDKYVLQGNLEPARLYSMDSMEKEVDKIISIMQNKKHIFNLGHGMILDLPRENAIKLVEMVHSKTKGL